MKTKVCTKCKEEKDVSNFGSSKRSKDKLDYWCKACKVVSSKRWFKNNPEKQKEVGLKGIERRAKLLQERGELYLQSEREYYRSWYVRNRDAKIKATSAYLAKKKKEDIQWKLKSALRNRLWYALKGKRKSVSTLTLLGCTVEELKAHLEKQFTEGMTWDNYGKEGWEIDHILPCASFDLTKESEQRKCFHYTNLQPLWKEDNIRKGDKIQTKHQYNCS